MNKKWMIGTLIALLGGLIATIVGRVGNANVANVAAFDLNNQKVHPLRSVGKGVVFLFVSVDCPISNRYAPEIERLNATFSGKGMTFWIVYPNADESLEIIRKHTQEYFHDVGVLRDPGHALVRISEARVTPEAAVFLPNGKLIYHGRIDDRLADYGVERQQPTRHDLQEILIALAEGKQVTPRTEKAVGCYISNAR